MTNKSEFEIRLERSGVTNPALVNLAKEAYELGLAVQQKRIDELVAALDKYGQHMGLCSIWPASPEEAGGECDCGFDKALQPTAEVKV